ncbi:GntR family transcriptional regulator [Bacillus sp. FJAT-45037]|uniref:GntR family transcriptional regulator n=1 Tax=Bacillus sp. FJAT-45037 TaxID=2011007 RepID=UPI0012FDC60B|nr:GntR family transcriptional regulator [Bacillus sp. FJAT-45037]
MWIHLDSDHDDPLYQQVKRQIIEQIVSGELITNKELPSIRKLAMDARTSVITIKRAYTELEQEGFIYTRKGIGSFVKESGEGDRKEMVKAHIVAQLEDIWKEGIDKGLSADDLKQIYHQFKKGNMR